ncbi:hypothetical protein [Maridesulfovibrio hydrothermalis]|uniref:Uncharacterized protein n=1 Tax=Maridesulfovibrio hydrothermalis AM13 = DSM 14728 TaxID=1121451 RepID=L0R719_9BACT|nr:hypothetical protein [Maridesulfovibrio hydrothermalis]CCO21985.1 membrane protein of unknown function [Maridesulfovibrio hydrothermalis AM13 = DSM 14728]
MIDLLIWIGKTCLILILFNFLFPPILHKLTCNNWIKFPLFICLGIGAGIFMAWMTYVPYFLLFIWIFLEKNTLAEMLTPEFAAKIEFMPSKPLFYISSYSYILVACLSAWFLQIEVCLTSGGEFVPFWKTLLF